MAPSPLAQGMRQMEMLHTEKGRQGEKHSSGLTGFHEDHIK